MIVFICIRPAGLKSILFISLQTAENASVIAADLTSDVIFKNEVADVL
ncbi:MAG: hypothetical protein N2Z20_02740 [Elusimicrobiales bacterium]|nr:hypothetical protein [Elusimicrobiales bacterium]